MVCLASLADGTQLRALVVPKVSLGNWYTTD